MRFLADDLLEGRGTGTRGYQIAATYVASEFEGIGLEPAGENGTYFQRVPFRQGHVDEAKTSLTLVWKGKEEKRSWCFGRTTLRLRIQGARCRRLKRR